MSAILSRRPARRRTRPTLFAVSALGAVVAALGADGVRSA